MNLIISEKYGLAFNSDHKISSQVLLPPIFSLVFGLKKKP
ncbi:hypothetical protein D1AOALGA4SA_3427 [Olavius algarvensis Delta 1 endosymbiont]|nr:hypothetical protein D1AOALGA4SA_3427 [Olavius algarvensis Delta 1 endosymbiont]